VPPTAECGEMRAHDADFPAEFGALGWHGGAGSVPHGNRRLCEQSLKLIATCYGKG